MTTFVNSYDYELHHFVCEECGMETGVTLQQSYFHPGNADNREMRVPCDWCNGEIVIAHPDWSLKFKLEAKRRYEEEIQKVRAGLDNLTGDPAFDEPCTRFRKGLLEDMRHNKDEYLKHFEKEARDDAKWEYIEETRVPFLPSGKC